MTESEPISPQEGQKKRKGRNWMLVFLFAGIVICLKGYFDIYEALSSFQWPFSPGRIISSEIQTSKETGEAPSYYAHILYEYEVGGKRYQGDRVYFGEYGSGSMTSAKELVERYPVGKSVVVYYNAKQPERAVLERGARFATFVLILIGIVFGMIGLGGFVWWDRLHTPPKWLKNRDSALFL
ncbi:MAG: DUF3592 domain-containing protein [Syntrophales bacterium]|nr:DUF3592 domain-containing protein [Syntrophales bacterium]